MKECTSDSCTGLGRPAECVLPTSPARESLCDANANTAICLPTCDGGCRPGEFCVAGVCIPTSDTPEGGPGPTDGRPCPGEQVLVYETPGCGPTVKPVCDGPSFDACAMDACGCDGVTFHGGCGVFDRPFAHTGPCEDGAREGATGGDGRVLWLGAPCNQCDLPTQVARLAEPGSEDCGRILVDAGDAGIAVGNACARSALQAGRPFTLIIDLGGGIDSYGAVATVFAAGRIHNLRYDSNVCGGGPTCDHLGCGPWISSTTCVPVAPTVPGAVYECAGAPDPETVVCGPNPDCYGGVCL